MIGPPPPKPGAGFTVANWNQLVNATYLMWDRLSRNSFMIGETTIHIVEGAPESVVEAPVGDIALRTDGGSSTVLYVKESGTGNTGWVAK